MVAPPWLPLPPTGYGGIELVASDLTEGLVANGHEVLLFAPGDSVTRAELRPLVDRHVGLDWPAEIKFPFFNLCGRYAYARAVAEGVDLIHDHTIHLTDLPIPAVHTLHGPAEPPGAVPGALTAANVARWMSAAGPNHFVAISDRQRQLYGAGIRFAGTVHNGINVEAAPYSARKSDYLLFLGRANWEKGPDLAARVAARAGQRLIMSIKASEATEREFYRREIEPLVAQSHIEVRGEISPEEKYALLRDAAGTLFTSQWDEPFGLVMVESMACGTPALALRRGAAPEVIRSGVTGFLADDEDGLVEAVGQLAQIDPAACRAHVAEHFSIAAMVAGYERVYRDVLAAAPRRPEQGGH